MSALSLVLRWRPGRYLRASAGLSLWMLLRAFAQAAVVVMVSRMMGAQLYGRFVAIIAMATLLAPFAGLGLSNVLLRDGARDPTHLDAYLKAAARVWAGSASACIVVAWALAYLLLPHPMPWLVVAVAVASEIVANSMTDLMGRAEQARHRVGWYGAINAGLVIARLFALGIAFLISPALPLDAALYVYAASGVAYAIGLWIAFRPPVDAPQGRLLLREGVPFALASFSLRMQAEFNKPVLAHLGFALAGYYNAAQRAADVASIPLNALQEALWPRLYASHDARARLPMTGVFLLLLALLAGYVVWLLAPFLPRLLGEDFTPSVAILRWLALLPVLQQVRALLNFKTIHGARTDLVGWAYGIGGGVSVAGVAALVPRFGVAGAVASLYITEMAVIAVLGTSMWHHKSRKTPK